MGPDLGTDDADQSEANRGGYDARRGVSRNGPTLSLSAFDKQECGGGNCGDKRPDRKGSGKGGGVGKKRETRARGDSGDRIYCAIAATTAQWTAAVLAGGA